MSNGRATGSALGKSAREPRWERDISPVRTRAAQPAAGDEVRRLAIPLQRSPGFRAQNAPASVRALRSLRLVA